MNHSLDQSVAERISKMKPLDKLLYDYQISVGVADTLRLKVFKSTGAAHDEATDDLHYALDRGEADRKAYEASSGAPASRYAVQFDTVRDVVELARRLAIEDYFRHVTASCEAVGPEAKMVAEAALIEAQNTAWTADSACQSLISSETSFRAATTSMIRGDSAGAAVAAKTSTEHLDVVADKLAAFSTFVPQSKFFAATLNAVANADRIAGRLEAGAAKTVSGFAAGVASFASRVRAFGTMISEMPAKATEAAATAGVSVAVATIGVGSRFMTGLRAAFQSASNKVEAKVAVAKNGAWAVIDDSLDLVARVRQTAERAVDIVSTHGSATMGLAGGLMGSIAAAGRSVAKVYVAEVAKVESERMVRRAKPS